ncbi:MAG TPA: OB-fold domain-containing protein [Acidimicrobiales bacterium]|nr:OB-fold domain-containing protein [Acidimicrobiales bacterium]
MSTEGVRKPLPVPDPLSEEFWRAAAAHVLAVQRCAACGWYAHPPDVICVNCLSPERAFRSEPVSGRGRVRSWTVMHDAFLPGFRPDVPYVVVDVELDEQAGLRMIGQLVDGTAERLRLDARVEAVFDDVAEGLAVPQFRLAAAG